MDKVIDGQLPGQRLSPNGYIRSLGRKTGNGRGVGGEKVLKQQVGIYADRTDSKCCCYLMGSMNKYIFYNI